MARYSVAKAKDGLSALIAMAQSGEEVIITSHGKPVAELRMIQDEQISPAAMDEWLKKRREKLPRLDICSVELLRGVYADYPY